jgi:asparagine synthetase B (glutamine-hydrolysing)
LITNADPHSIGTVGVVGSGGVDSTVVALEDDLLEDEEV